MSIENVFSAIGLLLNLIFFLVGFWVYLWLTRQINTRSAGPAEEQLRRFGLPEIILASVLIALFASNVRSPTAPPVELDNRFLIAGMLLFALLVVVIAALLKFRGFNLETLGGFSRLSVARAFAIGAILFAAAYPLVAISDAITQHFLGSGTKQTIVELFSESRSMRQRMIVIVLAVAVAPMAEEFIFRFFLYGVLKRYLGFFMGLVVNAVLFAAAHWHLPSFAPLFVLGACFTIAYEWSGSILVSMAMHALFNASQLVLLAFPDLLRQ